MKIYKSAYVSLSVVSIIISIALGVAFITANKKAELWERRSKELLLVFIDTVKAIDERSDERAGAADDLSKEKERRIHKKKDQLAVYIVSRAKEAVQAIKEADQWNEEVAQWNEESAQWNEESDRMEESFKRRNEEGERWDEKSHRIFEENKRRLEETARLVEMKRETLANFKKEYFLHDAEQKRHNEEHARRDEETAQLKQDFIRRNEKTFYQQKETVWRDEKSARLEAKIKLMAEENSRVAKEYDSWFKEQNRENEQLKKLRDDEKMWPEKMWTQLEKKHKCLEAGGWFEKKANEMNID